MKLKSLLSGCVFAFAVAMPAAAHVTQYSAVLDGLSEIPQNASPGVGFATITVDFDFLTMRVEASFSGLIGNTAAAHIHCCTLIPGSANVGVATQTPTFSGFPSGVTSGTYDHTFDMALASSYNASFVTAKGGVSNAFDAMTAGMNSGNAYFNIHSSAFPGGEIRGLLHAVPEPQTYALLGAGLAVLAWTMRRRRFV